MEQEQKILEFAREHFPGAARMTANALGALVFGVHGRNDWRDRLVELEAEGMKILRGSPAAAKATRNAWKTIEEDIHFRALLPAAGSPRPGGRRKNFEIVHEQGVARRVLLAAIASGCGLEQASRSARASIMLDGLDALWMKCREIADEGGPWPAECEAQKGTKGEAKWGAEFTARCMLFILASAGRQHNEISQEIARDLAPVDFPDNKPLDIAP